ncbi:MULTISPECIES: arsenic metallochaperone ArsD family protein [Desulfonatronospira]|nr:MULTISPECIES: arsenic metallochaperone ArsD family protein [Desulfonatronospira]RQD74916.1 MAG: arsenical resistance operon transcriptional repressor ArsD [Desulfonatronospira sp. MSAO_Bac3]
MALDKLEIYLPYMACACTPGSPAGDRKTQRLQDALLELQNDFNVSCMVYALNMHLQQFRSRPELAGILQNQGKKGLPVIFINDRLCFQGEYPDRAQLEEALKKYGDNF